MRPALAACAVSLAAACGLGPGAATALAGPGVTLTSSDPARTERISGATIRAEADVSPRTFTVRSSASSPGTKIRLSGLSIRKLLELAGFDPDTVDVIQVGGPTGRQFPLRRAEFAAMPPFPEGPALVADEPGGTRYLRPVRGPTSTNSRESFVSTAPLGISVEGSGLLAVSVRASPRRTSTRRSVSFSARVRHPPPGATLTYSWDFGDGTQGFGARVTHRYAREGDFQARVIASGAAGSTAACETTCRGTADVGVRVGTPRTSPRPDTRQGTAGANPDAPGTGGSGDRAGGSDAGPGPGASGRRTRPQAERASRVDGGDTITGILLADSGTARTSSLPSLRSAGAASSAGAGDRAEGGGRLGGSIALTLALIALGALHERRGGRLRVA